MNPTREDYWRAFVTPRAAYYGWMGEGPKEAYKRMWPFRVIFIVIWFIILFYILNLNGLF